jgi:peptidoglycan/LPS O-acetylase OafA/YrhL
MTTEKRIIIDKRDCRIELLRFFFSWLIVADHLVYLIQKLGPWSENLFSYSGVATEFFFLISGYFLAQKIDSYYKKGIPTSIPNETYNYVVGRIKRIAPNYFVSFVLCFIGYCFANELFSIRDVVYTLLLSAPNFFLLSELGWAGENLPDIIGPAWYLDVLLISITILFPLCLKNKNYFKIGTYVTGVLLIGIVQLQYGSLTRPYYMLGPFYKGLVRGFAEICLGVFLYHLVQKIRHISFTSLGVLALSALELFSFSVVVYVTVFSGQRYFNIIGLLFFFILLLMILSEKTISARIPGNHLMVYLGRLSLSVFFCHKSVVFLEKYCAKHIYPGLRREYRLLSSILMVLILSVVVDMISVYFTRSNKFRTIFLAENTSE